MCCSRMKLSDLGRIFVVGDIRSWGWVSCQDVDGPRSVLELLLRFDLRKNERVLLLSGCCY